MGERAAHLTSSLQTKPSIFEVIAQESLAELIQPACKRIFQFLIARNGDDFQWLNNWFDECYLILNTVLQYNYLKSYRGSFSESFYGLQRLSNSQDLNKQFFKFRNREDFLSLLSLTLLPYTSTKLTQFIDRCNEEDRLQGSAKYLVTLYKTLHGMWRGATLVQYLQYMTGKSHTHSLLMKSINVSLHYIPEQPLSNINWQDYLRTPQLYSDLLWRVAGRSLELSVFFLQCLQWWQSEEFNHKTNKNPIPPPPKTETVVENSAICPVCKDVCQIETVLSVSGYVFCYRCIQGVISKSRKCPVTELPATIDDLIRIYPSN